MSSTPRLKLCPVETEAQPWSTAIESRPSPPVQRSNTRDPGWIWRRYDKIAATDTRHAERAALLAAAKWANKNGELYPSLDSWARMAGVTKRRLQQCLKRLAQRELVEVVSRARSGSKWTTVYRIPCLSDTPVLFARNTAQSAKTQRGSCGLSRKSSVRESETASPKQQRTAIERPATNSVVAALSLDLQNHPNATPERVAWIDREAPTKRNPAAWAATAIRKAFQIPKPTAAEAAETRRLVRDRLLADFDSMPEPARNKVIEAVRARWPNLSDPREYPPTHAAVRGGIAKLLQEPGAGG